MVTIIVIAQRQSLNQHLANSILGLTLKNGIFDDHPKPGLTKVTSTNIDE